VIWNFAQNIDTAKLFLVDYMAHLRDGFQASGFQNMPTLPSTVPNLATLVAADAAAGLDGKYAVLSQAGSWTTNLGAPGYTNAAIMEVLERGIVARLFGRAAIGELTPEASIAAADGEIKAIFRKWRETGKL
jgi:multiple sugar transport system substrate-binding protein